MEEPTSRNFVPFCVTILDVERMRQMAECETVHDKDRLFALYTDDVIFRDVALDVLATGKDEVRQLLETVYAAM